MNKSVRDVRAASSVSKRKKFFQIIRIICQVKIYIYSDDDDELESMQMSKRV